MQRLLAACLAGPAVASHRSAATLWQLPGFDPAPIEVTAVRHLRRHACDVVWHESRRLDEREVTAIDRIPVTRAARTLVDLGSVVDVPALQAAMDDAIRRNLVSTDAVLQTIERLGERRRGAGNVRTVLKRRLKHGGIPESVIESAFDELVRSAGLQPFERQYVVCDARGAFVARVDFARPDRRLGVEIDSVRHHAGVDDWRHDLARQNQLLACRWRLLRFTAHDLERRPEWIVRMVLAALDPTMRI